MKKILIAMPSLTSANGVARVIMNYSDELILNGYQIDYLIVSDENMDQLYYKKIINNKSKIFVIPKNNKKNRFSIVKKYVDEILKKNNYDFVHVNLVDLYALAILVSSKKNNVPRRIYHIHNPNSGTTQLRTVIKNIFNKLCINNSNVFFACSELAANSMLKGKKYKIIRNVIDVPSFKFDIEKREYIRKKYNIEEDMIVIGTVARIEEQKNPFFMADIIKEMIQIDSKIIWLYIGDGTLRESLEKYVFDLGIKKNVIFVGSTEFVNEFYSSMDILVLPSKFEGLGMSYIEAQSNGMPVYASDCVPKDIKITDLVTFLSLKDLPQKWAEIIYNNGLKKVEERKKYNIEVINNGYDIDKQKDNEYSLLYNYEIMGGK